ncbi:DUF2235 domain-containing protein [Caballeronia sp. dw_276]|uniref:DUF2235 domain-containing protein n=1 Tax=Caballeronia sp. dw_276 TaxID=2719795 RepID=UPI001BD3AC31|nr:DUF2235 domain-containing protein [Caballeronia sp. dw_276]
MPKNIVFCADGTWNGPNSGEDDDTPKTTNVWKLFLNLASDPHSGAVVYATEQESSLTADGKCLQVAKYLHGVGDSNNAIIRMLGGVFGWGLIARIVRGYTFISRNYEDGDRIFIVGFSRGSYTARALGGLIADQGVLNAKTLDLADPIVGYRNGVAAWRAHRSNRVTAISKTWNASVVSLFRDVTSKLTLNPPIDPKDLIPGVKIQAIGVWDTVGALGIPLYVESSDSRVDVFRFADTALSPAVKYGLHAISVDEQRGDFTPTLWDKRANVTQVLFPGAHSDVGGGYPSTDNECGLSDGSLAWMTKSLATIENGIIFQNPFLPMSPSALGVAHQPWANGVFVGLPHGPRDFVKYLPLGAHYSIRDRLAEQRVLGDPTGAPGPYAPSTLADYFKSITTWVE